jgi:16S rRNA (guanine(966)-N(2))-methyltransferase RsmD
VIAGSLRGRKLVAPEGERVRPTKDMVREAVFSALDARGALADANVLDLYAGSGALAIEAISRGAAHATVVERDRSAIQAINTNIDALELHGRVRVVGRDVDRTLREMPAGGPFDLVFADPPYETPDRDITALLVALTAPGWLTDDAIVVVERPEKHPVVRPKGWRTGWERGFGDTLVSFCWR